MKEKLWSPKKPKPGWVIWYEDMQGTGDKHTFILKVEAGERIRELIEALVKDEFEWRGTEQDVEDEEDPDSAKFRLSQIKKLVEADKPWDALSEWEAYAQDFTPDATLHVEETTIYGA